MTKRMERLLDALTGPAMAFEGIERWREVPLAHQGLVGPDAPGNSLEAFDKAARSGYGIELDVRLCKDGLVVLHDRTVDCAGGVRRRVRDMTRAELLAALPKGCAPELGPALMLIAGRVPVAVELKSDGLRGAGKLARAAAQALGNYAGPRCVLSFDPASAQGVWEAVAGCAAWAAGRGQGRHAALVRRGAGLAAGQSAAEPRVAAGAGGSPGGCAQPRHSRVAEAGQGMRRVDAYDPGTGVPCACAGRYRDIRRRGSAGRRSSASMPADGTCCGAGPDCAAEPGVAVELDSAAELDNAAEPGIAAEPGVAVEPDSAAELDSVAEPGIAAELDSVAEPGIAAELDSAAEPGIAAELDSVAEPGIAAELDSVAEQGIATELNGVAGPGIAAELDCAAEPGGVAGIDSAAEPGVAAKPNSVAGPGAAAELDCAAEPGVRLG